MPNWSTSSPTRPSAFGPLKSALNLALVLGGLLQAAPAGAAKIIRGPYLQMSTPDSIIVRWRTDEAAPSRVDFGKAVDDLSRSVESNEPTTEHIMHLEGLSAGTQYFYSAGDEDAMVAGDGEPFSFVTPPESGSSIPTRIWVLGDPGTWTKPSRDVRDAYYALTGDRATDLVLMLGDNAYQVGNDQQFQLGLFENKYEALLARTVFWPTFGNHDSYGSDSATQSGPYYDIFSLPTQGESGGVASGTEAYYSFDHANAHYICIDSASGNFEPGSAQSDWLRRDLEAARETDWIIAFCHHPPYTKGSHDSDNPQDSNDLQGRIRREVLPLLEAAGVDLFLTGHSHNYERSYPIMGHFGTSDTLEPSMIADTGDGNPDGDGAYLTSTPRDGTPRPLVHVMLGSSGNIKGNRHTLDHPVMAVSLKVMGSVVIDIDGLALTASFILHDGQIGDSFSIIKTVP